jgi:hypothetical protein
MQVANFGAKHGGEWAPSWRNLGTCSLQTKKPSSNCRSHLDRAQHPDQSDLCRCLRIRAADLAAVVHMQLAAAVAAPQQSRQQQLAFTSCSASECAAHAGRIVGDYLEVALELVPGDVGRVVILDQDIPFGHGLLQHHAGYACVHLRHSHGSSCRSLPSPQPRSPKARPRKLVGL